MTPALSPAPQHRSISEPINGTRSRAVYNQGDHREYGCLEQWKTAAHDYPAAELDLNARCSQRCRACGGVADNETHATFA
jgi:hypothetical protein